MKFLQYLCIQIQAYGIYKDSNRGRLYHRTKGV